MVQLGAQNEAENQLPALALVGIKPSASRWVQHEVKQRADAKSRGWMTACMHAYTNSSRLSSLDGHPAPGSSSKRANALLLGSPKDLGLLFIRPYETCYCSCSLPVSYASSIGAVGDSTFPMPRYSSPRSHASLPRFFQTKQTSVLGWSWWRMGTLESAGRDADSYLAPESTLPCPCRPAMPGNASRHVFKIIAP